VNYSTVVGLGGVALVGLNFWDGDQRKAIAPVLSGKGSTADAHAAFKELGAELVFVVVATVLAGLSNSWGVGMCAVIVGLLIIWSINRTSSKAGA
jgi:hypothetical protein